MNLFDLGLRVLAVIGLGMNVLVDQSLSIPGLGEMPQGTGTQAREFQIVGALNADGARHMKAIRSGLIDAFKPDVVTNDQPMILRYQEYDGDDPCSESLDIICKYRGGLEGQWDNNTGERVALGFKMYLPMLKATFGSGTTLGYQTSVANANYILQRGTDGIWAAMGTGMTGANAIVYGLAIGPDGSLYATGNFTAAGGVANTLYIARWNGTAWSALGTGLDNAAGSLAIGPDGSLYVGGAFTNAGGVAANYIAKWNGTVWSALGTGMDAAISVIAMAPNGTLYAGGSFTHAGGGAANYIAKWNGSAWSALGTGTNGPVLSIAVGKDNTVYAGGIFTSAGGVANTLNIAKWDGTNWSALGSGAVNQIWAIGIGPDGSVYAGGSYVAGAGTINVNKWNGMTWGVLGTPIIGGVQTIISGPDGKIYIGGSGFSAIGNVNLPDSMAVWNGTNWIPLDVDLPGSTTLYSLAIDKTGIMYAGFGTNGSATSATIQIPNVGSSATFPIVTFIGPGTLWQLKNYTTGKAIYFNLTLLAGETAVLNLDPLHFSFTSTFRGNLLAAGAILPGSNTNFELMPGTNNVSAYMFGSTTAATSIVMTWQDQYNSLDGAAWK